MKRNPLSNTFSFPTRTPGWVTGSLLCAWTFFAASLCPAQTRAQLDVSAEKIGVNEQLVLTITVSGDTSISQDSAPELGSLQGFRIVSGPSTSSQFQWINGRTSSSLSFQYVLLPDKPGRYTLGPFAVPAGGARLQTNAVQVEVTADSGTPAAPRPGRRAPGRWPPGWPTTDEEQPEPAADPGDGLFVAIEPSRRQAYPGQRIDLAYRLYTRFSINSLQLKEAPALQGFWVEDIKTAEQPVGEQLTVQGKPYTAFVVKRQAVYPNTPGKWNLPAALFSMEVRTRGSNPFSFFDLGTSQTVFRRTEPVAITVLPFPASGKPAQFQNLAGRFELHGQADKTEAKVGEAVSWNVTLSGTGNLNTAGDLPLPAMPDFQLFSSKSKVQGGSQQGTKTWDLVLIPQKAGRLTIPGIQLPYFDPEAEAYKTAASEPIPLRVSPAAPGSAATSALPFSAARPLTRQGTDINFIKLEPGSLESGSPEGPGTLLLAALFLAPLLLNVGLWWRRKEGEKEARNAPLYLRRRAAGKALDTLRRLEKNLSASAPGADFYSQLGQAFALFLSERFELPAIDLTREQVEERLLALQVPADEIRQTLQSMDHCDFARFAPSAVTPGDASDSLRNIRERIRSLDHHA